MICNYCSQSMTGKFCANCGAPAFEQADDEYLKYCELCGATVQWGVCSLLLENLKRENIVYKPFHSGPERYGYQVYWRCPNTPNHHRGPWHSGGTVDFVHDGEHHRPGTASQVIAFCHAHDISIPFDIPMAGSCLNCRHLVRDDQKHCSHCGTQYQGH